MGIRKRIDKVLQRGVRKQKVPGVVAMVTNREETLYEGHFGERVLNSGAPMTLDTVFRLASMTKAITSVAALQLVERGRLDLDAPARNVLPAIGAARVVGQDPFGNVTRRSPKRPVTLRHLLTHTAGFSYPIWKPPGFVAAPLDLNGSDIFATLLFDPGECWEYGVNTGWVGQMVERASGMPLDKYFARYLFDPLEMTDTTFTLSSEMASRLAGMHRRDAAGSLVPSEFTLPIDPRDLGGGGLYGTAGDYLKFIRMVLNGGQLGGERVLKPESVALLGVNHMGTNRVRRLESKSEYSNDVEFFPGIPKSWSLAFQVNHAPTQTGRPAGGLMWAGLANTYFWIDPITGLGGVYLTQILPFADSGALPLYYAFEEAVYDGL